MIIYIERLGLDLKNRSDKMKISVFGWYCIAQSVFIISNTMLIIFHSGWWGLFLIAGCFDYPDCIKEHISRNK